MRNYKPLVLLLGAIAVGPVLGREHGGAHGQAAALLRSETLSAPAQLKADRAPAKIGEVRPSVQAQASELLQGARATMKTLSVASNQPVASAEKSADGASAQAQRLLKGERLNR